MNTKTWTQSKIMIRSLLVMVVGIIGAVIPFLKEINVSFPLLSKIAEILTITNIDAFINWADMAVGVIAGILGLSIWIARKRSQGEKIVGKSQFPRSYDKR